MTFDEWFAGLRDVAGGEGCGPIKESMREAWNAALNQPDPHNFWEASKIEAQFQQERWGNDGDEGKTDADWFWLIGYLAGKALHNPGDDAEKRLHRITTIAAAAKNWHAARLGESAMRPGIAAPKYVPLHDHAGNVVAVGELL